MTNLPAWAQQPWLWQLLALAALVALARVSLVRVPQGFERMVERGGRYRRSLTAGTHFVLPLLDQVRPPIDIRETALRVRTLKVVTRDEVEVEVSLSCFVQVTDAAKASYEVRDAHAAVEDLVAAQVANHLAACPLGQLVADRERALRELPERLDRATDVWGIKVTRLDVSDVKPPQPLLQAILEETRAEHEQRARLLEAEGARALAVEEVRKANELAEAQLRHEQEQALATEEAALALSRVRQQAAEQQALADIDAADLAARTAREAARRAADDADAEAASAVLAARQASERELELARVRSEEARERAALALAERAAEEARAWRETLDGAQRAREEAQLQQRLAQQQAAHEAELARIAEERLREEARHQRALATEAAEAAHREALAAAAQAAEREARRVQDAQAQAQLEHDAAEAARALRHAAEQARIATEAAEQQARLAANLRAAELVHAEAVELARARQVAAEADAASVQLLSNSLQGVNAHTLAYLAARENAQALRSLGGAGLGPAAAGAAASLVSGSHSLQVSLGSGLAEAGARDDAPSTS
jgi:regulator of protease activity HflC (stomatin/prohibitin superfamily)